MVCREMTHKPAIYFCDCGRPAVHRFSGWECARCYLLRQHRETANKRWEKARRERQGQAAERAL